VAQSAPLHRKPTRKEQRDLAENERAVDASQLTTRSVGPLRGKVAVITGASRGIGLAIATALAAEECDLVLAARDTSQLKHAAATLARTARVRTVVKSCDVRNPRQVDAFFRAVSRRFPRIDILVNNAGIAHPMAPAEEVPVSTWNDVIATNLTGMFLCARAAVPLMTAGGVIVNNLSVAATDVFSGEVAYIASKWGARGLTNALREELRPRGIRVLGLIPGPTDTDIWNQFWPEAPRDQMVRPEHVAQAVLTAITMPAGTAVEEIRIGPTRGKL
jgi:NAD(P)-dependent dehydrogenase (short-subunit alcohol dehydrogenase family)